MNNFQFAVSTSRRQAEQPWQRLTIAPPSGPSGAFTDGYDTYGLEGNESFDSAAPTLKDGTPFTPEMTTLYNAFMTSFLSNSSNSYHNINVMNNPNVYQQARRGQLAQLPATAAFRMTGDLRILDRLIYGYTLMNDNLANGWSGHNVATLDARSVQWASAGQIREGVTTVGNPWGTHRALKWTATPITDYRYQTDIHNFDEGKSRTSMAEFAWMLHLNRGKTSPAAHNYATLADKWAGIMGGTDGVHTSWWWAWSGAPITNHWARFNYRGITGNPEHTWPSRAAPGTWPVYWNDEGHTAYNNADLNRWLGLLGQHGSQGGGSLAITSPADAAAAAVECAAITQHYWVPCIDSHGFPSIITRGSLGPTSSRYVEPLRGTYTGYAASSAITSFLTGAYPATYSLENMRRLSRAYADMFNPSENGTTVGRLSGNTDHCGHGLTLSAVVDTTVAVATQGYASMLVFADESETDGDRLWNCATAAQNASGGGYGASTSMHVLPAYQFLKRALDAIGVL